MNHRFNILWFEDELQWYQMEQRKIESILEEHCLEPVIKRENGENFNWNQVCTNSYDLILIDYKLASDVTGDTIIKDLRNNNILTDTLFYSSGEASMLKAIHSANPPLDGIYYTKRDSKVFTEKVKNLINKIVKRSEHLVNLRGFVLDGSCDFETRIKELLKVAWEKFTAEQREALEEVVCSQIDEPIIRCNKGKGIVTKNNPIYPNAVNYNHYFSHCDRLEILSKVIDILTNSYGFIPDDKHKKFKKNYEEEISWYRNALGHRKANDYTIEICGQQIPVDSSLHKNMRINMTLYDKLIRKIEEQIQILQDQQG